jgi:type IV secretory pathway VirB2 component (pilin)
VPCAATVGSAELAASSLGAVAETVVVVADIVVCFKLVCGELVRDHYLSTSPNSVIKLAQIPL